MRKGYLSTIIPVCVFLLIPAVTMKITAQDQDIFTVDPKELRNEFEKDFSRASDLLSVNKFQDLRSVIGLIEHRLSKGKKAISKDEALQVQGRIDKVKSQMNAKVDSLVNRNLEILRVQGVDPAVAFLQREMRMYGVPEEKLNVVDNAIMTEAPKIKAAQEKEALTKVLAALESGGMPDPGTDPYILSTARRIYKVRQDSIRAIEEIRLQKEQAEQMRVEKIKREQEEKARKEEEKRQSKVRKEEEKKRIEQEKIDEKKRIEEEKIEQVRLESERKQREAEEKERKRLIDLKEKSLTDSIENAIKEEARRAKLSKKQQETEDRQKALAEKTERDRQERQALDEQRRVEMQEAQERTAIEKARKDSIEAIAQEQERIAREQNERDHQAARAEQERQAQLERQRLASAAQERQVQVAKEKARRDSLDAIAKEQERIARDQHDRERIAQLEQERKARAEQERLVQIERQRQAEADEVRRAQLEKERQARMEEDRLIRAEQEKEAQLVRQREAELDQERSARADQDRLAQSEQRKVEQPKKSRLEQESRNRTQQKPAEVSSAPASNGFEFEDVTSPNYEPVPEEQTSSRQAAKPVKKAFTPSASSPVPSQQTTGQYAYAPAPATPAAPVSQTPSSAEYAYAPPTAKAKPQLPPSTNAKYMQQLAVNEKQAQNYIVQIYSYIEEGNTAAAISSFKANRNFIAQYVGTDVFNVLEQTIVQTAMSNAESASAGTSVTPEPAVNTALQRSEEQTMVARIEGYLRQNKVESAHNEFERVKKRLKGALTKSEYKDIEQQVTNAWTYYRKFSK